MTTTEWDLVQPYSAEDFRAMRVLEAWRRYDGALTWGRGQCLALLDDGCDVTIPEWRAALPWGRKVVATWNSVDGNADCRHVPPGYHGTTIGMPSSLNHDGKRGLAFNNFVAHVRCVSVVHLVRDESHSIAAALRWVIEQHQRLNITTVNLAPVDDQRHQGHAPTAIDEPLRILRELGIWVSAPCANHGYTDGISWPACAKDCFAIGGVKAADGSVHNDRFSNTDLLVPAAATSSSNAFAAAASMILREAIRKTRYDWTADGANLPEAMMAIFKRTGVTVRDPGTGLEFGRLDLLAALEAIPGLTA